VQDGLAPTPPGLDLRRAHWIGGFAPAHKLRGIPITLFFHAAGLGSYYVWSTVVVKKPLTAASGRSPSVRRADA